MRLRSTPPPQVARSEHSCCSANHIPRRACSRDTQNAHRCSGKGRARWAAALNSSLSAARLRAPHGQVTHTRKSPKQSSSFLICGKYAHAHMVLTVGEGVHAVPEVRSPWANRPPQSDESGSPDCLRVHAGSVVQRAAGVTEFRLSSPRNNHRDLVGSAMAAYMRLCRGLLSRDADEVGGATQRLLRLRTLLQNRLRQFIDTALAP
jgi:hypothetical protein